MNVTTADAAGLYLDKHLTGARFRDVVLVDGNIRISPHLTAEVCLNLVDVLAAKLEAGLRSHVA